FRDQVEAWSAAERAGQSLGEHLAAAGPQAPIDRDDPLDDAIADDAPRAATRGGVNGPASPVHPPEGGGRQAPLSIDDPIDARAAARVSGVKPRPDGPAARDDRAPTPRGPSRPPPQPPPAAVEPAPPAAPAAPAAPIVPLHPQQLARQLRRSQ